MKKLLLFVLAVALVLALLLYAPLALAWLALFAWLLAMLGYVVSIVHYDRQRAADAKPRIMQHEDGSIEVRP